MKQLKWVIALVSAAIVLCIVYFIVDARLSDREERAKVGAAKTLFSFNSSDVTKVAITNEEGYFCFEWDFGSGTWEMTSADQFKFNTYAVSAICNYFCSLQSLKTVVFDCEDTAPFGFDNPVTLKVYTTQTGEEHPYVLYVGDNTPTFDAYYVMVEGSNDIYTIDYTEGSVFCVAKDTLKNRYLFDTFSTNVTYYRLERDDETVIELQRDRENLWSIVEPSAYDFSVYRAEVGNMIENLVRITIDHFVEENPEDLAQYGLAEPAAKVFVRGTDGAAEMTEEIWFGDPITDAADEVKMYAYLATTKQVFVAYRADMELINGNTIDYVLPYCVDLDVADIAAIHLDLGDWYDMDATMYLDYANDQYAFNEIDVDALENDEIDEMFQNFFRAVNTLRFTELDLHAKPEGESVASITYTMNDGSTNMLEFIPQTDNNFYVMLNGAYTGKTIRLNRFTGSAGITQSYEALVRGLQSAG